MANNRQVTESHDVYRVPLDKQQFLRAAGSFQIPPHVTTESFKDSTGASARSLFNLIILTYLRPRVNAIGLRLDRDITRWYKQLHQSSECGRDIARERFCRRRTR
jgi:hypothetical protein